ncbi:hypothetical protein ACFU76_06410 [Streptomyces sp. NPDC057539]|uniref:hypothetical protein n=1 Tax=Streptomyces sp. NPDC057539 TaxID=3346159 RepID=UPI0036A04686
MHSVAGQRLQAMDGVTMALDVEAGLMPVGAAKAIEGAFLDSERSRMRGVRPRRAS